MFLEDCMKKADQLIEVGYGVAKGDNSFSVGKEAAGQALLAVRKYALSAMIVFCSANYDLNEVLQGIHSIVGKTPVFGATAAGEICGKINRGTVTVTALASPYLRVHCGVGTNVTADWRRALETALDTPAIRPFFFDRTFKEKLRHQGRDFLLMFFPPGVVRHSDYRGFEILEALKEKANGDLVIMGGGATDDLLEQNHVFYNQQAYPDSVLLVVWETALQFGLSLTHGFRATGQRAIVTSVMGNEVLTIDGVKAVDAYSRLVDVPKEEINGVHPVHIGGATIGISDPMGQHTVNLVDSITPQGSIRLTRPVSEGTMLTKMNPTPDNLVLAGAEAVRTAAIRGGITNPALCLVGYCLFRPVLLGELVEQEFSGMREVLADRPLIGFCCCGEIGVAADGISRFNTSSIACLVLGGELSRIARIRIEYNELLAKMEAQSNILARTNEDLLKEIAERKKTEAALRESETKLKDFALAMPDISLIIDEDGRYIEVFGSGYPKFKYRREGLNGCKLQQQFSTGSTEVILKQIKQTISSGTAQCMVYQYEVDGETRFFESRTAPMRSMINGRRIVAVVAIDVTERLVAERKLEFAYALRRKSDFFNDLIDGAASADEEALATAKAFGIDLSLSLCCSLLTIASREDSTTINGANPNEIQMFINLIEFLSREPQTIVWECQEGIGVLWQAKRAEAGWKKSRQLVDRLCDKIIGYDPRLAVKAGVSNWQTGINCISEIYRQAATALTALRCWDDVGKTSAFFCEIGIMQLLASRDEQKSTHAFIRENLGKLLDYDQKKGTDLLTTLEVILYSNNLKEAAGKMFIHYKTIAFRKQRIEKILGITLDNFETKLALGAAVKLYKIER
jgi:PAS domain S-box-containing protein